MWILRVPALQVGTRMRSRRSVRANIELISKMEGLPHDDDTRGQIDLYKLSVGNSPYCCVQVWANCRPVTGGCSFLKHPSWPISRPIFSTRLRPKMRQPALGDHRPQKGQISFLKHLVRVRGLWNNPFTMWKMSSALLFISAVLLCGQDSESRALGSRFSIHVQLPVTMKDLPIGQQLKNDIELVFRRNGLDVVEEDDAISKTGGQLVQLTFRALADKDQLVYVGHLKLELLVIGVTLKTLVRCSGKPANDPCFMTSGRLVALWEDESLFTVGKFSAFGIAGTQDWPLEVRRQAKDLAESFALFYLRDKQASK